MSKHCYKLPIRTGPLKSGYELIIKYSSIITRSPHVFHLEIFHVLITLVITLISSSTPRSAAIISFYYIRHSTSVLFATICHLITCNCDMEKEQLVKNDLLYIHTIHQLKVYGIKCNENCALLQSTFAASLFCFDIHFS